MNNEPCLNLSRFRFLQGTMKLTGARYIRLQCNLVANYYKTIQIYEFKYVETKRNFMLTFDTYNNQSSRLMRWNLYLFLEVFKHDDLLISPVLPFHTVEAR